MIRSLCATIRHQNVLWAGSLMVFQHCHQRPPRTSLAVIWSMLSGAARMDLVWLSAKLRRKFLHRFGDFALSLPVL